MKGNENVQVHRLRPQGFHRCGFRSRRPSAFYGGCALSKKKPYKQFPLFLVRDSKGREDVMSAETLKAKIDPKAFQSYLDRVEVFLLLKDGEKVKLPKSEIEEAFL